MTNVNVFSACRPSLGILGLIALGLVGCSQETATTEDVESARAQVSSGPGTAAATAFG